MTPNLDLTPGEHKIGNLKTPGGLVSNVTPGNERAKIPLKITPNNEEEYMLIQTEKDKVGVMKKVNGIMQQYP